MLFYFLWLRGYVCLYLRTPQRTLTSGLQLGCMTSRPLRALTSGLQLGPKYMYDQGTLMRARVRICYLVTRYTCGLLPARFGVKIRVRVRGDIPFDSYSRDLTYGLSLRLIHSSNINQILILSLILAQTVDQSAITLRWYVYLSNASLCIR